MSSFGVYLILASDVSQRKVLGLLRFARSIPKYPELIKALKAVLGSRAKAGASAMWVPEPYNLHTCDIPKPKQKLKP